MPGHTTHNKRTREGIRPQIERFEVREVVDGRWHGACMRAREVSGMSGRTLARTAEEAAAEVEFCCVLNSADVARQREALVAVEVDIAAVRVELADRER